MDDAMNPWSSMPDRVTPQSFRARPFGPRQGWVLMIGFFLVQILVGIIAILARGVIFVVMAAAAAHRSINLFHLGNAPVPPPLTAGFITALGIGSMMRQPPASLGVRRRHGFMASRCCSRWWLQRLQLV
ncbi:MAG: hypothetical protein B7X48_04125 [Acidiphilium sp. 34-60-192]|nr:MAG: hypothetical protein B7X48_04125 [Acidiphilium sp. 34-60-192]